MAKKRKKSKKKNYTIVIVLVLLLAIIFVVGILYLMDKDKEVKYDSLVVNIGEDVPKSIEYTIGDEKVLAKIDWKDIKEDKIYNYGTYKGTFTVQEKKYEVILKVNDKDAPKIEGSEDITIEVGSEINLTESIKTIDNSKDKVDLKLEGDYDLATVGEYTLKYVAVDKAGNKTEAPFKLNVIEKKNEYNEYQVNRSYKGYLIENRDGVTYVNGILIANKTYSLPDWYAPGLTPELNENFAALANDASSQGLSIYIISGFRSYWDQSYIYNNYVARDGQALADTYSARAGHSEHQTGLAVDVNSLETWFGDTPEGIWLKENCYKYGFIIRYPYGKDDITGYQYEPWHLRYVGVDVAKDLYNNGDWITLEEYLGIDSYYH